MGLQEPELVELVHKLDDLEQKLRSHPLHKVHQITYQSRNFLSLRDFD